MNGMSSMVMVLDFINGQVPSVKMDCFKVVKNHGEDIHGFDDFDVEFETPPFVSDILFCGIIKGSREHPHRFIVYTRLNRLFEFVSNHDRYGALWNYEVYRSGYEYVSSRIDGAKRFIGRYDENVVLPILSHVCDEVYVRGGRMAQTVESIIGRQPIVYPSFTGKIMVMNRNLASVLPIISQYISLLDYCILTTALFVDDRDIFRAGLIPLMKKENVYRISHHNGLLIFSVSDNESLISLII